MHAHTFICKLAITTLATLFTRNAAPCRQEPAPVIPAQLQDREIVQGSEGMRLNFQGRSQAVTFNPFYVPSTLTTAPQQLGSQNETQVEDSDSGSSSETSELGLAPDLEVTSTVTMCATPLPRQRGRGSRGGRGRGSRGGGAHDVTTITDAHA